MEDVTIVRACLRDDAGGSPTAVLDERPLSDEDRRRIPVRAGTSHAVFVGAAGDGPVPLRFFTAAGELPACGHGTVAALAYLAARAGGEHRATLRASGGPFAGRAVPDGTRWRAAFGAGPVDLRDPAPSERDTVLSALGLAAAEARVAAIGRPRLLVEVTDRDALAALTPDLDRLRAACDAAGFLGCYVHTAPTGTGRVAARMFAPSIGVPEDIANANSTACLAAHLANRSADGVDLTVDMGDALGSPATITATARPGARLVELGGTAVVPPA